MKTQKLLLFLMEIYIDYLFLCVSNISRNGTEDEEEEEEENPTNHHTNV